MNSKQFIVAIIVANLLALALLFTKHAPDAPTTYLFGPSGVIVTATGQELSRQQLLDVLLHNAVERTPGLSFKK